MKRRCWDPHTVSCATTGSALKLQSGFSSGHATPCAGDQGEGGRLTVRTTCSAAGMASHRALLLHTWPHVIDSLPRRRDLCCTDSHLSRSFQRVQVSSNPDRHYLAGTCANVHLARTLPLSPSLSLPPVQPPQTHTHTHTSVPQPPNPTWTHMEPQAPVAPPQAIHPGSPPGTPCNRADPCTGREKNMQRVGGSSRRQAQGRPLGNPVDPCAGRKKHAMGG